MSGIEIGGLVVVAVVTVAVLARQVARVLSDRRRAEAFRQEAEVQRRVRKAPLRVTAATQDGRNTFVTVRPTRGDSLPREVLEELYDYIGKLPAKDIPRKLDVEYRDGEWQPCKHDDGHVSKSSRAQ
jgi:hypothetical protein